MVEAAPPIMEEEVADVTLSQPEITALKKTGQIDRDVPKKAMEDITTQYKYFLRKGRGTMCAFSRNSEQYLAYARQVFRERGMPEELANLAIVESGYRPTAVSRAGAVGAWQFMPFTGAKYGLTQDWWQDDRLDPYRATEAAADYLQKLYNDFGDWPTAIAAYNAGEGKMSRALAGTGSKNFFEAASLNHILDEKTQLREETQQYVPKFMAVTKIMRNLPELGFDPIQPENQPGVMRLSARPGTDLSALSRACNLSLPELKSYNLHHKRNITCTDRHTFVYVPTRAQKLASEYLCSTQAASFAGWKPTKVAAKNDSLEKISKRANVSLAMLKVANPGMNRLDSGQIILAPAGVSMSSRAVASVSPEKSSKARAASMDKAPAATAAASKGAHVLKNNETLYAVARKYNVSVQDLMLSNNINNPGKLRAGIALNIPGKKNNAAPHKGGSSGKIGSKSRKATYTVRNKDNLWAIARKHRISVDDLKRWNKTAAQNIKPGDVLIVAEE